MFARRVGMDYADIIQKVLLHIDENVKVGETGSRELNADALASVAGFSTYHFCRMFQWHTGYSVMEYVRLRRLAYAVSELSSGRKLIDIAMDYGFETHSGFTKAFKRHYGVSPERYRINARGEKPLVPDILRMNKLNIGGIVMEPIFVTLPAIKIAGYEIKTKNTDGENNKAIPAFWTEYLTDGRVQRLHGAEFLKGHAEYGACFAVNPENGEFSYVIGVEVKDGASVPDEFHTCELPPATYAMFSTPPCTKEEFSNNIQGTWQYIMDDWFPGSGYEYAPGCVDFEYYGEKAMSDTEAVCDIYIPVVKRG